MISFTQWKYVQPCETWWTRCTLCKNTQTCQIFNNANLESPKISQTHHITLVGLADNRKQRQNEHLNAYFLVKIVCHGPKQLATKKKEHQKTHCFLSPGILKHPLNGYENSVATEQYCNKCYWDTVPQPSCKTCAPTSTNGENIACWWCGRAGRGRATTATTLGP